MRYPINDSDSVTSKVKFSARMGKDTPYIGSVQLYVPTNITVGDSASYGTMDLGAIGGKAQDIYDNAKKAGGGSIFSAEAAKTGFTDMISTVWNNKAAITEYTLLEKFPDSTVAKLFTYNARKVRNPHTTATFDKVDIRSFKFSFKLIAESKEEALMIKSIDDFFRINLYPEIIDDGLFLKFPPIWEIKFIHKVGNSEKDENLTNIMNNDKVNGFLPKIHDCFLRGYSSSYNSEYSSFHEDGAPFSVSFDLDFTETKPYSRLDILTGIDLNTKK